jgi:hypothetical protein
VLTAQLTNPKQEFVRFLAAEVYTGQIRQTVLEQFAGIVKRAFGEFIRDQVNDRLRSALNEGIARESGHDGESSDPIDNELGTRKDVQTLPEELEAFYIVKALLRQDMDPKRIAIRDTKSYCGILLDDNNRKPLCRLYFHGGQKYIGLFNDRKEEQRHPIADLNEVYGFGDHFKRMVTLYDTNQVKESKEVDSETPQS